VSHADSPSVADRLVALLAAELADGAVVATGVASPLAILAIAVARATHAPRLRYLACVGSLDPNLDRMHDTPEDLRYLDERTAEVAIPDLFDHARRGRIDTVFFGAAQVDARGDTNMSVIGSLAHPKVKLPGVAGAATLRRWVKRPILVVPRHDLRTLVRQVDVASTSDEQRSTRLYTNLAVFDLGPHGARLAARHEGVQVEHIAERTGFAFIHDDHVPVTASPSLATLEAIHRIDPAGRRFECVG
jgi:glutaconate CoA-transferase subunit B